VTSDLVLERLKSLHVRLIDLSLDRVLRLLHALGDPHEHLPPVVHVAGTNGKGSTLAFLRACLEAAGYRVHVYTSPHLVRFNERIRVAGHLIAEDALLALLEECERVNAGAPVTFFEITTAVAFLAFARTKADVALLETGLGGRFDATNVIAHPAVTAITPISLDHQHFLGDTIAKIAFEKAGILKSGAAAVLAAQTQEAEAVLEARARDVGAPLARSGREWSAAQGETHLVYRGRHERSLPPPGLLGPHQYENAGTAIACIDQLGGFIVPDEALARGMREVEWPARLQRLERGALASLMPKDAELWLDGAHNPAGGAALARVAEGWRERPLSLVFGMLNTHDPAGFLAPLAPFVARLAAVAIPGEPNARPSEELADAARRLGIDASPAPDLASAVARAALPGGRTLICGSLYLAGRVLAENG
jgi:dihydrofolate synthase / folylpolyglutamate synthase